MKTGKAGAISVNKDFGGRPPAQSRCCVAHVCVCVSYTHVEKSSGVLFS